MKFYIESNQQEVAEPGEVHLHIRFRPANGLAVLLALLIHALLLYFILTHKPLKKEGDSLQPESAIVLLLDKDTMSKMADIEKKKEPPKPKLHPAVKPKSITRPQPPQEAVAETPPTPAPQPDAIQQPDMMSMLTAARERRRAAEEAAAQENEAARQGARGMSPQEVAEANVRRSMQQANNREGTSGVFQILSKSTRMATFSFRGWKPSRQNSFKKVIEVDAGLGGNIELAIIRRMIVLIREEYQGDFSWDSRRLGRVINLSARPQDTAELETFMMKEFFGNPNDR
ncbi:hypothetical protein LPB67_10635 [Undibacterium sp. Jales W-56]|uniref:hypothetical protein n=1 Tax=Undibacterium sp. Jales W-56 TaxID=2897325 RepID=UPI0021D185DF|nr:hypothetical protein [Undibacterium sp. Jales W-56]MCU6434226.1 hypothetical protein [Undibacterium sp. Jales W-56]